MTCASANRTFSEEQLSDRIFQAAIHTLELYGVHLGRRLGLYARLRERGPCTAEELAAAAGIAVRYAREWLEQQAVAGLLAVDDPTKPAEARRYSVPDAHAGVLVDPEHPAHVTPLADMIAGIGGVLDRVVEAYRSGRGVPYEAYGAAFRQGQGALNRPALVHDLAKSWLPAIPDLHRRLAETPGARIADVGCGVGWSTIALARAYPAARVTGYDLDPGSVAEARQNAAQAGVAARFELRDAGALPADGPFDLILIVEALHDIARPTDALAAFRKALAPDGSVVVVDERVASEFTAPGDPIERFMYGWSIVHCLPAAMTDPASRAVGTVFREGTLRRCAQDAGFSRVEVLPIENPLFRFYRLAP